VITSLQLRSGGEHSDLGLLGPAGTTAITSLQMRSGGEHCDPAACCSGPAGCNHEFQRRRRRRGEGQLTLNLKTLTFTCGKTRMMKNDNSDLFLHKHAAACRH
jgi:hypothetical protein